MAKSKKIANKSELKVSPVAEVAVVAVNELFDRSFTVVGNTTEGIPIQTSRFTVTQLGLRDKFITSDNEEFEDSINEVFGVLK